ncbi:MAG: YhfC family intrarane metalloprotease [Clostridiales bacterium]|jgi:uncharacterized membrane protein YhfC|nr:YhfC family intrarane metalloprotease [Clostridiales bacterium]
MIYEYLLIGRVFMISSLSITFMVISLLIVFIFPIGLWIYFYKKEKISGIAVLVGALTFIISQILLRMPLLQLLQGQSWYSAILNNIWLTSLFLSLTAGIFEEVGRSLSFKLFLRRKLEWKNGIAFGIGHGGIEAITLIGLTYVNNIVFSLMINLGAFDQISGTLTPGLSEYIVNTLANANPVMFLLGGLERVFAIIAHIAFSIIVLYGVKYKKAIHLVYAILGHTLLNAPTVIFSHYLGAWAAEVYILIFAVAALMFIKKSKRLFINSSKAEQI